jgi:uncharacterized protein (UPF0332 family)
MTEETEQHFRKAADCVEDSQILLDYDRPAASVARAYYAMFHAATAALAIKGIKRSSHRGLLSAFGEYLVKPGLIDSKYHRSLIEAFELRQHTDYEPIADVDNEQAREILDNAIDFVDACRKLCK